MSYSSAKKGILRIFTVLLGPATLVLIILSLAQLIGLSHGFELAAILSFLTPIIGVISILTNPVYSRPVKLFSVYVYYPIMLVLMFLLGISFGCKETSGTEPN